MRTNYREHLDAFSRDLIEMCQSVRALMDNATIALLTQSLDHAEDALSFSDGLDVILGDEQVKSVFVNVFGGITACDAVANGIVKALEILGDTATKPLVVRLDGNAVEEGRRILQEANHPLVTLAATMDEGADKAAELAHSAN